MGIPRQVSSEGVSPQTEILNEIARREQNARPEFGDTSDEISRLVVTARGLGIPQKTILETQIQAITANPFLPKSDIQWSLDILGARLKEEQTKEQLGIK